MIKYLPGVFAKSINRMIISSFVFVLLLPVLFFVYSLFQNSWEQVEQRILEKHQLISSALIVPFTQFINTKQDSLHAISNSLQNEESTYMDVENHIQTVLQSHLETFENFVAISYSLEKDGPLDYIATYSNDSPFPSYGDYSHQPLRPLTHHFHNHVTHREETHTDFLSSVFKSRVSGESVVLIKHHMHGEHDTIKGTIYAEVALTEISSLCADITFGSRGHCTLVDHLGRVISHPNKAWVSTTKDLSNQEVVKKVISGESGTDQFYSPRINDDFIVGFSHIPELGWGVLIPQPKSEVTTTLYGVQKHIFIWLLTGVFMSLILGVTLAYKINKPIKTLIQRTHKAAHSHESVDLGPIPKNSPIEIVKLWSSFARLLAGLTKSHQEVKRLNESLSQDIKSATDELRQKNKDLYKLSILDHLTSLPNRRFFTDHLDQLLINKSDKKIGVIFIDIDYFKSINDTYGHDVGDEALIHAAELLKNAVRKKDLVARLGGDEFIIYIDDANQTVLSKIANSILKAAHQTPLKIKDKEVFLSLSLGTLCHESNGQLTTEDFFKLSDKAMYESKTSGRNKVTHYSIENFESAAKS